MSSSLEDFARVGLSLTPTPLQRGRALGQALRVRRELWIKRDDLTGSGMGGNKVRKLEYLLGDARAQGADVIVTGGAGQSNHARLTAIAGKTYGFAVHLVLGGGRPVETEGNLLLGHLAGATVHHVESDDWRVLGAAMSEIAESLTAKERVPYLVPIGGSTPIGVLGYARAYLELVEQLAGVGISADWIVHASSTGGTQAGLLVGRVLARGGPLVVGVDVAKGNVELTETILDLGNEALEMLGSDREIHAGDILLHDAVGGSYGEVTERTAESLVAALRAGGLVTDPVYSAKALSELPYLEQETLKGDSGPIIFLHTGGQPALFTQYYAKEISERGART